MQVRNTILIATLFIGLWAYVGYLEQKDLRTQAAAESNVPVEFEVVR